MGAVLSVGIIRDTHLVDVSAGVLDALSHPTRCDGDGAVMDEIPPRILRLFGHDKARPKVLRVYDATKGWAAAAGTPIITWRTVDGLLKSGSTSAELKWRFKTKQVSILDLRRGLEMAEDGRTDVTAGRRARTTSD